MVENRFVAKFSVFYNQIDDILSVYDLKKDVCEVFELSEFLNISFDKGGHVVGLEIFDASKFLSFQNSGINFHEFLSKLKDVELEQSQFRNNWLLMLRLSSNVKQQLPLFSKNEYKSPLLCSA